MREEIFRMERVTCMEGEMRLLEDFNLQIYRGEIMGMVSVNSHGLSAFLRLLETNRPIYDGYVYLGNEKINSWKESNKGHNRISIIQAESSLISRMSVADNVFVLRQGFGQEIIRPGLLRRQLLPFLQDIGVDIPPEAYVEELTAFERIVVELVRAVAMGCRLIVLNDIGPLVSYEELGRLHTMLRHYAKKGFSFLYISTHFEEIARSCDRAALFSDGRILKVILKEELQDEVLRIYTEEYTQMVQSHQQGHRIEENARKMLRIDCRGLPGAEPVSFSVHAGECLLVQIHKDTMLRRLVAGLTGQIPFPAGGAILEGHPVSVSKSDAVAVVQELPTRSMIFQELDYMDNLCMALSRRVPDIWKNRKIRESIRREYGEALGWEVFSTAVEDLSEKQKYQLVYMRTLLQRPRVVFCIQPFKGADLDHRMYVWKMLEMLLKKGIAVVILCVNFSDDLSLADRMVSFAEDGSRRELLREEFSDIGLQVPWIHLYENRRKDSL